MRQYRILRVKRRKLTEQEREQRREWGRRSQEVQRQQREKRGVYMKQRTPELATCAIYGALWGLILALATLCSGCTAMLSSAEISLPCAGWTPHNDRGPTQ